MTDVVVFGFPRSTYVLIVRLVLAHKGISYEFRDLEPDMGSAVHLALHPFDCVPFFGTAALRSMRPAQSRPTSMRRSKAPPLQPKDIQGRARMHQWISSVNSYYYPYMIYHVVHERLVFPQLGIATDEKVVAHGMPKVARGLEVMENALGHGADYLLGNELTLADFFMPPSTFAFGLTDEGKAIYGRYPAFSRWRAGWK